MKFDEIYKKLQDRRERALSGKYNCIPLPFVRLRRYFPGLEKGKYIVVTANQKIGKTKLTDFLFVYETIDFAIKHPEIRLKIIYFCLEENADKKYNSFLSQLLFRLNGIRVSPTDLNSIDKDKPIDESTLELLKTDKYLEYIKKFEEIVTFVDSDRNPTGINKVCREYALEHGHLNYKIIQINDPVTKKLVDRKVIDPLNPYTPDDEEEFRIVVVDNAFNISSESGMTKRESIEKLSQYATILTGQLGYIFVLVQHQAQAQEGIENIKLDRMKPSSDGLADCKVTARDCNMLIGLYSPFKFGKKSYEGYDITKFRNSIRFMEILEDRDFGANNQICPLYFDGISSSLFELPRPDDAERMQRVYNYLERQNPRRESIFLTISRLWQKLW